MSNHKLNIRKQIKFERDAKIQSTPVPSAVEDARVTRLATDHVDSAVLASQVHSSASLDRVKKVLELAIHEGTGEHEAKQAIRLSAKMFSSIKLQKAQLKTCKDVKMQLQKEGGHSTVTIFSKNGQRVEGRKWTDDLAFAIIKAFNVKFYYQVYSIRQICSIIVFYGLRDNTVAAALSFEAVYNLYITLAVKRKNENSFLLELSSSIEKMAKEEYRKEELSAVENEKRLIRKTTVKGMNNKRENQTEVKCKNDQLPIQNKRRKLEEETPEIGWQSLAQLIQFRKMAEYVASEYLKEIKPNQTCDRIAGRASIHDFLAYRTGNKDTRNTDLKRRRLESA